jgi:hypothetical protein
VLLISPYPGLLSDVAGRNRKCRWKEVSVYVRNCKSFLLQRLKGSISGDARDFKNIETRAVIKIFFLQVKIATVILMINTTYKQNISHVCSLIRSVAVKIMQFVRVAIQFFNFIFLFALKIPFWWYNETL